MDASNLQSVLNALVGVSGESLGDSYSDASMANSSATGTASAPTDASAIISSLLSTTAMVQWLKLFVFGAVLETCRRVLLHLYKFILDRLFITVDIAETDPCYQWIMAWLTKQPSWSNARNIQLGSDFSDTSLIVYMRGGRSSKLTSTSNSGERKFTYKPSHSSVHSLWFQGSWLRMYRWEKEGTHIYRQNEEYLRLCFLSRNHDVLNKLLEEAEAAYKSAQENTIAIYVCDSQHKRWRHLANRRKRPLNSIVLDPGIKDKLIDDAREFLASQDWYAARGIPFRRGYLLYGAPGSGKTSIIQSLAGELELDIYIISLSRAGLDDNELNELISLLPERCIALMEDIDAAFISTINRDSSDKPKNDSDKNQVQKKHVSKVTLSGLLNALDGVAAQEGRILFATTNKYLSLDPALTRPGRMDIHVEFGLASKHQAQELYRRFYSPDNEGAGKTNLLHEDNENLSEKDALLIDLDGATSTRKANGNVRSSSDSDSPFTRLPSSELQQLEQTFRVETVAGDKGKAPVLSKSQLDQLATAFSHTLPEKQFSMAALQGYLMKYKTTPVEATRDFSAWIVQERKEQKEREARAEKEKESLERVEAEAKSAEQAQSV